jgi:hypothetical protein
MEWIHAYHATMRAALVIKARLEGQRRVSPTLAEALASELERDTGVYFDSVLVQQIADPPAGRLNAVVFRRLSAMFEISVSEIGEALFPTARSPSV